MRNMLWKKHQLIYDWLVHFLEIISSRIAGFMVSIIGGYDPSLHDIESVDLCDIEEQAVDEKQLETIASASNQLAFRKGDLENHLSLTHELKVNQSFSPEHLLF